MNIFIIFSFLFNITLLIPSLDATSKCNRPEISNKLDFPILKESAEAIRFITYNIRGESSIDVEHRNAWNQRKDKIGFLVRCYQPDLICLQGVSKSYMPDLFSLFSEYTCIAYDINEKSKDTVLLVHTERFAVEKQGFFWLSENTPENHSSLQLFLGGQSPRTVVWALILDRLTNKKFISFCAHFNSAGMESRIKNTEILMKEFCKIDAHIPVIIAGDFNFIISTSMIKKKSEEAYALIMSDSLLQDVRDISRNNHYGPDGTWIGWKYDKYATPIGTIGERLDHIFVRHFTVSKEGVLNLKTNNSFDSLLNSSEAEFNNVAYPSDHLPAIADIVVQ